MIGNIREAFIELLNENHWMDGPTRKVARDKALRMNERIGYPDFITKIDELNKEYHNVKLQYKMQKTYNACHIIRIFNEMLFCVFSSQLTVSRINFLGNIVSLGSWKATQNLGKLRKPVNKDKWSTEPAVVNAFYDPNKNDIGK